MLAGSGATVQAGRGLSGGVPPASTATTRRWTPGTSMDSGKFQITTPEVKISVSPEYSCHDRGTGHRRAEIHPHPRRRGRRGQRHRREYPQSPERGKLLKKQEETGQLLRNCSAFISRKVRLFGGFGTMTVRQPARVGVLAVRRQRLIGDPALADDVGGAGEVRSATRPAASRSTSMTSRPPVMSTCDAVVRTDLAQQRQRRQLREPVPVPQA